MPFACAGNLLFSGFSSQRSIFAHDFALSSADRVERLMLCSVPPPYGTTGSDVPFTITQGTRRVGEQLMVLGIAAPTVPPAAMRSLIAHPTRRLIKPPSDSPSA